MEYTELKTRVMNKIIRGYKKTEHTQEYLSTEESYKKVREGVKLLEVEIQTMIDAFSASTIYENITSGIFSRLEMVKGTFKKNAPPKPDLSKEKFDIFGSFSATSAAMSECTSGTAAKKFDTLSNSLKKVSASRVQLKESLIQNMHVIKELKEHAKTIDKNRVKILDIRQTIESAKTPQEVESGKKEFDSECTKAYEEMQQFIASPELSEIAMGIAISLKNFFGDAFDSMAEEKESSK
ncbi:hypothetical protein NEOKW01_0034 [Nematocida sp. AWRm80]|nr:hypothetical protein NEOKW01_0034 [Nematocida sp. AWRm80]